MVLGEDREQVLDVVVIVGVKLLLGQLHARFEAVGLLHLDEVDDALQGGGNAGGGRVGLELSDEQLGVVQVGDKVSRGVNEELVELVTAPFNAMLDLVGEVSEGTHGDGLLRGILRVTVALGLVGDNHLRVALSSEGAGFEEGLLEPDASLIDVETGMDVVDGVHHKVEALPEVVVEEIFGVLTHASHVVLDVEGAVHAVSDIASHLGLGVADVLLAEEELSVQVGHFNVVVVSHMHLAGRRAAYSHQGEGFDELAAQSSGTDHEEVDLLELLLESTSVDLDLVVVARVERSSIDALLARKGLVDVEVEPLLQRRVLSSKLHDFLGNDTSEESSHGRNHAAGVLDSLGEHVIFDFDLKLGVLEGGFGEGLHSGNVGSLGVLGMLLDESSDSVKSHVELLGSSEFGEIGSQEHTIVGGGDGINEGLLPGVELDLLRDLDVLDETLANVLAELSGVKFEGESEGSSCADLDGLGVVDLGHSLHLSERDEVSFLEDVPFILMDSDLGLLSLVDVGNDEALGLLSVVISHHVLGSVIHESESPRSEGLRSQVAHLVGSALGIESAMVVNLAVDDHLGVAHNVGVSAGDSGVEVGFAANDGHLDVRVELLELLEASLGSGDLSDVLLLGVEVGSQVINLSDFIIEELNGAGAGKNEVLGDFDSESTEADNDDVHLDKFSHSLHSEGADLARVEVSIHFLVVFHFQLIWLR
mmetsp:Transcript_21396/g.33092  ORF Transcript_21396/g.33092 Transcript_21396/m.33092 type:complete len:705 (+) Transcript_21396:1078-3192(+)